MSTLIEKPFPIFFDRYGNPLDSGFVYIGQHNMNPQTDPIEVFWDEALTQPAAQPIRTINGYYSQNGSPAKLYISGSAYSITVLDKNKLLAFSDLKSHGVMASNFGFSLWRPIEGGYAKNDRVTLDNGDIVKSTVANNTTNPNVDMTGWVNTKDKSYIGLSNVDNTSDIDKPLSTATNLAIIAANQDKATKQELATSVAPKANKVDVDTALSNLSTTANKYYSTLAAAEADIANIALNQSVTIGEEANGGLWYKATAGATTLTKSPYDPLTQSKIYTDQKTVSKIDGVLGKNLFDKSKVTNGKGLGDTGGEITAATRSISDFIPVLPNTAYSFTSTNKVCFYDSAKVFVQLSNGALANVISASNAAFMRIDVLNTAIDQAQAEVGALKTQYESYGYYLRANFVRESNIQNESISSDKIAPLALSTEKLKDAVWLNMHNPALLRKEIQISDTNGITETANAAYDVTEYVPCLPSTQYTASTFTRVYFYRKDGSFISNLSTVALFTTPAETYKMRFMITVQVSSRFQVNIGDVLPATQQPYKFELPKLYVKPQTKAELNAITARKYNFSDAWVAWRDGQKFPICFLGDSTTNGNGTTGYVARTTPYTFGVDYVAPGSYSKLFQDLIREATGNSVMRAYNAGYSGQNSGFALTNIDAIMSGDYADTKMLGISHGINDRTSNPALYSSLFYTRIEDLIKWCFGKGIQPFLLTTQPVTIPSQDGTASGSDAEEVANEIKRNLAVKYNLEIIDVNKFGQQFMQYSTKPLLNDIQEAGNSFIHFGNGGHKFTAGLLFANFCKRCISTKDGEQLDYMTQLMRSDIRAPQLNQLAVLKSGFKTEVNATQVDATDKLLQEFYVFNAGRKQLNLTAYYANAVVGQYVEVNGVQTAISQQAQVLGALDLGLHKIKAYSGATTQLDWLGFRLTP